MRRREPWTGGTWGIGMNAAGVQFRGHTDANGRPVDASGETETQRRERIEALQSRRDAAGYREAPPSASPAAIINECRLRDPAGYGAGLAAGIAEGRYPLPVLVVESPGRPADLAQLARLAR
jgi:hypothetical protein